jgi:tRNA(Ile)-lysidine synthase
MIQKVLEFSAKHQLFTKSHKLLLATSGGIDSMFLTDLLLKNEFKFALAHCNFKLRNNESENDKKFIEDYAKANNIEFFSVDFETEQFALQNKLSIQEAARNLRYNWLENIRKTNAFDFILTAHHLDDNIETLLFNLTKGTGIKGIRGMLPKNGKVVRPLLEISKDEIKDYILKNNISYREDSSNALLKYDRNKLRHNVLPILKEINQNLHKTFINHFETFREIETMHQTVLDYYKKRLFEIRNNNILIPIKKLLTLKAANTIAFELFSEFGFNFNQIETLLQTTQATEIKQIVSANYRIIKDKKHFIIQALAIQNQDVFVVEKKHKKVDLHNESFLKLHLKPIEKHSKLIEDKNYAFIDAEKLTFPLLLRKWKDGDYFYPISSAKAKKKKVAKKKHRKNKGKKVSLRYR